MAEILIVDDDEDICAAFQQFLTEQGHEPLIASNAVDAVDIVKRSRPDLVIMDIRMPGTDGLEALRNIRQIDPDVYVVIMTAYGTSQTSIEAVRLGAFEYLSKPLDLDVVKSVIDKAVEARVLSREVGAESSEEWEKYSLVNLAGSSPRMQEAYKLIGILATNDLPVLLVGERGVGKELVAKTIHFNSRRKGHSFVAIQCRDLAEDILETEILGLEAGAAPSRGKLEAAQGGTLFLDDVDTLTSALQAKLRRFLADGTFERVGGTDSVQADTRVVAATRRDLVESVRRGLFSAELFDCLNVVPIQLPPLRERRGDIPELVAHFVRLCNAELGKAIKGVDHRALQVLQDHGWPGNVGELENAIKRAAVLARSTVITADELGRSLEEASVPSQEETESALQAAVRATLQQSLSKVQTGDAVSPFHEIVGRVGEILVGEALAMTSGNQQKAAELLGLNRTTLRKKMRSYRS
jgi:two-component system nitrogen regulation response regulator GlnG